jgi:hypothetical protein
MDLGAYGFGAKFEGIEDGRHGEPPLFARRSSPEAHATYIWRTANSERGEERRSQHDSPMNVML